MDSDVKFAKTAHNLVDQVIEAAIRRLEDEDLIREKTIKSIRSQMTRDENRYERPKYEDFSVANIDWLTIEQFSEDSAIQKIEEFIKTWVFEESWLHCVDYLGCDEHEFDTRYRFSVRWSIPTRRKPIPRATASVYFTFEVSKITPKTYPVNVFYVFEANQLVHRPGYSRFREQWLKDIIESKVITMESIDF